MYKFVIQLICLFFCLGGVVNAAPPYSYIPLPLPEVQTQGNENINRNNWKLVYVDSEETVKEDGKATNAFDGNTETYWHTAWSDSDVPHEVQINMGKEYTVTGFKYLPRQDSRSIVNRGVNGTVKEYKLYLSLDGTNWNEVSSGTFGTDQSEKKVTFSAEQAQYFKFVALSEINNKQWTSVAELNILQSSGLTPPNDIFIQTKEQ